MRTDPEALDRQSAQAKLPARLVELRSPEDVHALSVRKVESQRVEAATRHRSRKAGAALRILEREEHRCPAFVAAQLGDLALDPDGGQAGDPLCDPLVERR